MAEYFSHPVQIYYEDTDFSGLVYHPNYLKYFERAREHMLGVDELVRLYRDDGVGFVVYKAEMTFKEGAVYGDRLDIRTVAHNDGPYRAIFNQSVWREDGRGPLVEAVIQMVAVDKQNRLVKLPAHILAGLAPTT